MFYNLTPEQLTTLLANCEYKKKYEALLSDVKDYYDSELILRGDRNLNAEYLKYFKL